VLEIRKYAKGNKEQTKQYILYKHFFSKYLKQQNIKAIDAK